jgi:hypothetical protein
MKNIVLFIILLLTLSTSAEAVSTNPFLVPCGATGLCPTTQYRDLGTGTSRVGTIYAENINISTALVLGGAVSGNVNMADYNINDVGTMYVDVDNNSGIGSTADNSVDFYSNGLVYMRLNANNLTFQGGSPTLTTVSNTNLNIAPNGTGITKFGDAMTKALSVGDNDDVLVTGGIEVGESIFTGGMTLATNRGDVPVMDFPVTNASASGVAQSIPFMIDGQFIGVFYAESDGAGGIQNKEVRTVKIRNYGDLITAQLTIPNGTTLPATCSVGHQFQDTDSDDCADTAGGDGALCLCKATNTWALVANI